MNLFRRLKYDTNWNVGFCEITKEEFLKVGNLGRVRWLHHPYKDRWFADPFILSFSESEIVVFVEECPIENPKGIICELVIDRKTMVLKSRYVLLELDTHLSYPAIIRKGDKIYVYPENGASGSLKMYEYNPKAHKLENPVCVLNEAVADSTILEVAGQFYLAATRFPKTQEEAFLYKSDSLVGPYIDVKGKPFESDRSCSRPAGNFFEVDGTLYRPAQNCASRYGAGISLMKCKLAGERMEEEKAMDITPLSWRYEIGIHTLNFCDDLCVIDGAGYLYPYSGYIIEGLRKLKRRISKR